MSNFRKRKNSNNNKNIISNNSTDDNHSINQSTNSPTINEKNDDMIDIDKLDDIVNKISIDNSELVKTNNNLKKLNGLLLNDIDKKDKKIILFDKKINDISIRHSKKIRDNKKELNKIFSKMNLSILNYRSIYSHESTNIKDILHDLIISHQQNLDNTNSMIDELNNKYINQIEQLTIQFENKIKNIHTDYQNKNKEMVNQNKIDFDILINDHNSHIDNIKNLHLFNEEKNNQIIKDLNYKNKLLSTENQRINTLYNELSEEYSQLKNNTEVSLNTYKNNYNNSQKIIQVFQEDLDKNITSLYKSLKNDKFSDIRFYNICIYNNDIEYDFEFKKNLFKNIFYDINLYNFENYSNNKYLDKYLNITKHIEDFLNTDKDFLIYIDSDIKSLFNRNSIVNHLRIISNLSFDLLLLNTNYDFDFINHLPNLLKVNNIKSIDSFIINKIYANKFLKIISDSINKITKYGFSNEYYVESNFFKISNDKNSFLYYPSFFKNKKDYNVLFVLLNMDIDVSNIGYEYQFVQKTDLDISYYKNNTLLIPEKDDFINEIINYYHDKPYDIILIINNNINLNHKKCFVFLNKYFNSDKILIDRQTGNLFINFNNNYNYNDIFNQSNNINFLKFDL